MDKEFRRNGTIYINKLYQVLIDIIADYMEPTITGKLVTDWKYKINAPYSRHFINIMDDDIINVVDGSGNIYFLNCNNYDCNEHNLSRKQIIYDAKIVENETYIIYRWTFNRSINNENLCIIKINNITLNRKFLFESNVTDRYNLHRDRVQLYYKNNEIFVIFLNNPEIYVYSEKNELVRKINQPFREDIEELHTYLYDNELYYVIKNDSVLVINIITGQIIRKYENLGISNIHAIVVTKNDLILAAKQYIYIYDKITENQVCSIKEFVGYNLMKIWRDKLLIMDNDGNDMIVKIFE